MSGLSAPPVDPSNSPTFQAAQERARQALQEAFAAGELDLLALETRLVQVEEATRPGALASALEGLRMPVVRGEVKATGASRVRPIPGGAMVHLGAAQHVRAYFSHVLRIGSFDVAQQMRITNFLGRIELDFREANLPEQVDLEIRSFWGTTHIFVPARARVSCQSAGFWTELPSLSTDASPSDGPRVQIRGHVVGGRLWVTQAANESWSARAQRSLRRFWPFR